MRGHRTPARGVRGGTFHSGDNVFGGGLKIAANDHARTRGVEALAHGPLPDGRGSVLRANGTAPVRERVVEAFGMFDPAYNQWNAHGVFAATVFPALNDRLTPFTVLWQRKVGIRLVLQTLPSTSDGGRPHRRLVPILSAT